MGKRPPPRKSLGQHYLIDANILHKIVSLADLAPGEPVLEIGPGPGDLTRVLLDRGHPVAAVEIDERFAAELRQGGVDRPGLHVFLEDAVKADFAAILQEAGLTPPVTVIGNFPYNVGTHLLRRLLPRADLFRAVCALLQEEVIRRIIAAPGNGEYGYLSLYCRLFAEVTPGFRVKPGSFFPPPNVRSQMVYLRLLDPPRLLPDEAEPFLRLVSVAFTHRRKTLLRNLCTAGFSEAHIRTTLASLELPPAARAEEVGLVRFLELYRRLPPRSPK
ncbi:MAG: ribosomal RNA small subunit methyltransferase A [Acidobacteria bacterium]|nr:ribosomal RNA small subunit methyltransferase A [Acidobacteriota bacterium]